MAENRVVTDHEVVTEDGFGAEDGVVTQDEFVTEDGAVTQDGFVTEDWSVTEDWFVAEDQAVAADWVVAADESGGCCCHGRFRSHTHRNSRNCHRVGCGTVAVAVAEVSDVAAEANDGLAAEKGDVASVAVTEVVWSAA